MNRLVFNTPSRFKPTAVRAPFQRFLRFQMISCIVGFLFVVLISLMASPFDLTYVSGFFGYGNSSELDGYGSNSREYYRAIVDQVSARNAVEADLVWAIISVESSFDNDAVSRAGAKGLMQLMPTTASEMKLRDPHDPLQNIQAGVAYFGKLLNRYKGNKKLALAAYNAGPGKVDQHRGIPPYRETQNYVRRVMQTYHQELSKRS